MYTVNFIFVDVNNQNPISGLPVKLKYSWPKNYFGYGAGSTTWTTETDGAGTVSFSETELNTYETNGSAVITVSTPKTGGITTVSTTQTLIGVTTYFYTSALYYASNNTFNLASVDTTSGTFDKTINISVKEASQTTKQSKNVQSTTTQQGGQANNNFLIAIEDSLSNAGKGLQTDFEIIAVLGALVVIAVIVGILALRHRGNIEGVE